jgi:hypothetical protein
MEELERTLERCFFFSPQTSSGPVHFIVFGEVMERDFGSANFNPNDWIPFYRTCLASRRLLQWARYPTDKITIYLMSARTTPPIKKQARHNELEAVGP